MPIFVKFFQLLLVYFWVQVHIMFNYKNGLKSSITKYLLQYSISCTPLLIEDLLQPVGKGSKYHNDLQMVSRRAYMYSVSMLFTRRRAIE